MTIVTLDLPRIIAALDVPGTRGLSLMGSFARGEETSWSDVDVHRYATTAPERVSEACWIDGRLVRTVTTTAEREAAELERPEVAVRAVLPLGYMPILVDRDGDLARIQERARAFDWSALRARALAWAWSRVAKDAENVLKLRAAPSSRPRTASTTSRVRPLGRGGPSPGAPRMALRGPTFSPERGRRSSSTG